MNAKRQIIKVTAIIFAGLGLVWGIAAWIYHAPLLHGETGGAFSMAERDEEYRYAEWCDSFPYYITPRICAYYKLHPECFKPTGNGEEIEIAGFADFVKNDDYFKDGHRCRVRWGKILDPWGDPIHFVQDLNMDGYIEAMGQRRIVFDMAVYDDVGQHVDFDNEHRFGICKDNVKGIESHPWDSIIVLTYHHAKWWPYGKGNYRPTNDARGK
jgi:hypothetical protein